LHVVAGAWALGGCGLQGTVGSYRSGGGAEDRSGGTLSATTQAFRSSNAVVGARTGIVLDEDGAHVKHAALQGGYDFLVHPRVAIEPALELGAGGPFAARYRGVGAYVGGASAVRFRLCGAQDLEPSFSVLHLGLELVVGQRFGWWSAPDAVRSPNGFLEYGGEIGLRLVLGSDLAAGPQGRPRGDEPPVPDGRPRASR
jgi:hypothetical protein